MGPELAAGGGVGCDGTGGGTVCRERSSVTFELAPPVASGRVITVLKGSISPVTCDIKSREITLVGASSSPDSMRTVSCPTSASNPPSWVQNFCVSVVKVRLHFGQLFILKSLGLIVTYGLARAAASLLCNSELFGSSCSAR